MNVLKRKEFFLFLLFILLSVTAIIPTVSASSANNITLKTYQAIRFSDGSVIKSDDKSKDLSFFVNRGRRGAMAFELGAIGAKKIKEFGKNKPDVKSLLTENTKKWKDYANAPEPGYYAILGNDEKSLYLINVISFKNQGKASAYWELNFTWEKLQ